VPKVRILRKQGTSNKERPDMQQAYSIFVIGGVASVDISTVVQLPPNGKI
jgi:hypothetical protein